MPDDTPTTRPEEGSSKPVGGQGPVLEVTGLRLESRAGTLVEDLSLYVDRGETLGLVGESGCGKTVTALAVLGLLPAGAVKITGGSIRFEGTELVGADDATLGRLRGNRIGMIFQEPMTSLNPVMRIGDQIGEVLTCHRGLSGRERTREVDRLLELVGLPTERAQARRHPFQLSGGQRQRVMIAMALACEPALLIADEPTTALDVTVQAQILALVREMQDRIGMACVLVTHDLGVVAETCARAAVMYAGHLVETGTSEAIFHRPRHRYTEALLGSIPAANPPGRPLPAIPGSVPPPEARSGGCRFRDRCSESIPLCIDTPPETGDGSHRFRCWNPA